MNELNLNKLKMQTPNKCEENIEKLKELFPQIVSEEKIDFDILKQLLSDTIVEADDERYRLDWVGKKASLLKSNIPIYKTLRPCEDESVDFENTQNLYIEGDNFEVLKVLSESYLNKIKMIYIDPPYNTGKDFVYRDNFTKSKNEFESEIGLRDEEGNKLFKNTDSNGRFHSDWLSMMYERLLVARDLLKDDGVIFISIDDNEVHNLRKICDEVFGERNFVGNSIWQSRTSISDDHEISMNHNHTIIYSKCYEKLKFYGEKLDKSEYSNKDDDIRGPWKLVPLDANKPGGNTYYPILNPKTNEEFWPPEGRSWAINPNDYQKLFDDNRIAFGVNGDSAPKKKLFYLERLKKGDTKTPSSILLNAGTTKNGSNEVCTLLGRKKIFSYPKPTSFISRLIQYGIYTEKDQIILDFFSGSSTTAHAVMDLNAQDGGNRKFIMVQLPEITDEKSEAFKAGYKNICEIGKERIRRAGKKIKEENKDKENIQNLDIGFRVLKVDSTNFKEVYYHPNKLDQEQLKMFESNIKEDRSDLDLLFAVMIDLGIELSLKITTKILSNKKLYLIENSELIACFENDITLAVIEEIIAIKPYQVVLKDGCFANDNDKINAMQKLADITTVSVI